MFSYEILIDKEAGTTAVSEPLFDIFERRNLSKEQDCAQGIRNSFNLCFLQPLVTSKGMIWLKI